METVDIGLGPSIRRTWAKPRRRRSVFAVAAAAVSLALTGVPATPATATASAAATATNEAAVCTKSGATGSSATTAYNVSTTVNDTGDDTSAIQSRINAAGAAGGGVVKLVAGIYIINGKLRMANNVKLQGAGPGTVLKAGPNFLSTKGPSGGYPIVTTNSATNTTITNLTADHSGNTLPVSINMGERLDEYVVDIRGGFNNLVDGVHVRNPFTYSIVAVATTRFCVKNSTTIVATSGKYDQLDGIHVLDSSFGDVISNTIDQRVGTDGDDGLVAHTINGTTHDINYIGNKVRGGHRGNSMQLAVGNHSIYNVKIADNEFYGAPYGIRTGYYDEGTGAVNGVSLTGNYIHDLKAGHAFPDGSYDAIHIGDFDGHGPITNVVATNNRACAAGNIYIAPGTGNINQNNTIQTGTC
ncbi:hypothetical protein J2790_000424 [Paenarthrobacter nicotinovorans]|uniref:Uncharacterized protein n=1 Tax=Paenarthrobacter nicotinovorans TaxID=29320 RepID=A0ABV0GTN3_PAENI|nr:MULTISPECIES: hypothetical protein [Micrococcaceae]MDR6435303.1 hypothetical protein [Paenarthrobacter nicotinovorans]BCW60001.1 hypothetical protein StoSoilB20_33480 [Arthrobacter sp. StoSoilB20]SCZ49414.1 hypothetical protein SAMN02799638_00160 [Arthrobacter sp. UNCCL28]